MSSTDWHEHKGRDPYPQVEPSLLNSQHIYDYAQKGCLVDPFDVKQLNKPASYTMRFFGELHSWRNKGGRLRPHCETLTREDAGRSVKLQRNSITYIFLDEKFRLPEYIAARFNLHIRHVHKGLLLGTGPLVDPGFEGSLLIPLHNLTDNAYTIEVGDDLIWVEFTKLTRLLQWTDPDAPKAQHYVPFPSDRTGLTAQRYFEKSGVAGHGGVVSSIASTLAETRRAADDANRFLKTFRNLGFVALVALTLAALSLVVSIVRTVNTAQEAAQQARTAADEARSLVTQIEQQESEAPGDSSAIPDEDQEEIVPEANGPNAAPAPE